MPIVSALFGVLFFVSALFAVISLFKPGTLIAFKYKSRAKAFFSWLSISIACVVLGGIMTPPQSEAPKEATTTAAKEAPATAAFVWTEEQEQERQAAIAKMVARTTPVQAEVQALYKELLAMRGTTNFAELGFSSKNKTATDWKQRTEALRDRIEKDDSIAPQVRAAPAYLLGLGLHREWRKGGTTDMSKWDEEMVLEGINWKPEE